MTKYWAKSRALFGWKWLLNQKIQEHNDISGGTDWKGQESRDEQGAKTEEDQQEDQEPDDDQSQDYQDDQDGQESQIKQDVTGNKEVEKNLDRTQKSLDILGESGEHWALTWLDFLDTETKMHTLECQTKQSLP